MIIDRGTKTKIVQCERMIVSVSGPAMGEKSIQ